MLGLAQGSSIGDHVRENGGERYVKNQVERALNAAPQTATKDGEGPIIRLQAAGTRDRSGRLVQGHLIEAGVPVYVRGGRLVKAAVALGKERGGPARPEQC